MAVAKLVCGDCGGTLALSDVRCPSCGASIEREASAGRSAAPAPAGEALRSGKVACTSCGVLNGAGNDFCGSCGAPLPARRAAARGKAPKPAKQQRVSRDGRKGRFDVWQIISAVALLVLIAAVAYLKISGDRPSSQSSSMPGSGQGGAPFAGIGSQAVDLTPLEDAVRERPADAGAMIKLANALEDNRMFPRAVDAYKKYLTMRPKDPDARTDLGICYFQMALSDSTNRGTLLRDAAAEMESAFTSAPRPHQPSAFNLGVVYLHLDQPGESTRWFKKAVEINSESDFGRRAQSMIAQQRNIPQ